VTAFARTDVMMSGQDRGCRGLWANRARLAESLQNAVVSRLLVTEVEPESVALQAAMEGYEVVTMERLPPRGDTSSRADGHVDVITVDICRHEGTARLSAISDISIPKFIAR